MEIDINPHQEHGTRIQLRGVLVRNRLGEMEAQLRAEQNVFVLLCDAGRVLCPGKHLFTTKYSDIEKNMDLIIRNKYEPVEETVQQLTRRYSEDSMKEGEFDQWLLAWYPREEPGKWRWPNAVRVAYNMQKYPFAVDAIPTFYNKCVMPSSFFQLIDGVGNQQHETKHHVVKMLKQFFLFAIKNRFPQEDLLSPSQQEAAEWFTFLMEAFGALIAVAHPRYGIFNTSLETVARMFPWLDEHTTVALGTILGGVFASLQSILANHAGWQDLFKSWQKHCQVGYQSAKIMLSSEALGFRIMDLLESGTAVMPTTISELDRSAVLVDSAAASEPFIVLAMNFFELMGTYMASWCMQRKDAEQDHNELGLHILEKWHTIAVETYPLEATGELLQVSHEVFKFMLDALASFSGGCAEKVTDAINKRLAMSTEQASLGVLSERVSKPLNTVCDVDSFYTAFKQTKNITKSNEFLGKLDKSRAHLCRFLARIAIAPEATKQAVLNGCNFNIDLSNDHSFVQSINSSVADEKADADKFNKQVKGIAAVQEAFRIYQETLRNPSSNTSGDDLVKLRDEAITSKSSWNFVFKNLELGQTSHSMIEVAKSLLAPTGSVGRALGEDGVAFLLNFRKNFSAKVNECKLECGGLSDGSLWHPDEALWDDKDAITAHFNRTVGQMQGPAVELKIEAMVADLVFYQRVTFVCRVHVANHVSCEL